MSFRRVYAVMAWVNLAGCVLLVAGSIAITFLFDTGAEQGDAAQLTDVLGSIGFLPFALVGAIIASRRPENRIGALMCFLGFCMSLAFFLQDYGEWVLVLDPQAGPFGDLANWMSEWPIMAAVGSLGGILLLFPDGRLPSRRWRWVGRLLIVGATCMVVGSLVTDELQIVETSNPFVPSFLTPLEILFLVGFILLLPTVISSAFAPFTRWRRADPVTKEQLKWFAYAAGLFAISSGGLAVAGIAGLRTSEAVFDGVVQVGLMSIPTAIGVALMRFRLYDIERVISRTASYAVLTVALAGTYAAVVLVPTAIIGSRSRPDWLVAAATLVVAATFVPLRRRVQDRVDRRFNRARYDTERTIETFTARLREQVDIDALSSELRTLVSTTMHPAHVSLWMKP